MTELTIGQKLWFVPGSRYGKPHEVTITKVGQKYVYLNDSERRIHKDTLLADGRGYSSSGRCWLSQEVFEAEKVTDRLWDYFHRKIRDRYSRPADISVEDIRAAMQALHLEVPADAA